MISRGLKSVSYTHLDVYKRQGQRSGRQAGSGGDAGLPSVEHLSLFRHHFADGDLVRKRRHEYLSLIHILGILQHREKSHNFYEITVLTMDNDKYQ